MTLSFTRLKPLTATLLTAGIFMALPLWAFAGNNLGDDASSFVLNMINGVLQFVFVNLATMVLHIGTWLFDLVLSADFNNIPLTHGFLVDTGWTLMRDIANLVFSGVMVVMAFGTLLGVESYSWRKILPRLIIAALLVNFTKLFAGIVVDAANLIMSFLITNGIQNVDPQRGIGTQLADVMGVAQVLGSQLFDTATFASASEVSQYTIASTLFQAMFLWSAGITLILLAFTMVTRTVRLWLLVILSPLVVAASVLPATAKFWAQWKGEFVKWVFMGVNVVFVVYLAALLAQALVTQSDLGGLIEAAAAVRGGRTPDLSIYTSNNFIGKAAPILMFLLIVGLLNHGRKLAAEGAGAAGAAAVGILDKTRSRLTKSGLNLGRKTFRAAGRKSAKVLVDSRIGQKIHGMTTTMESTPIIGGVAGYVSNKIEGVQKDIRGEVDSHLKRLKSNPNDVNAINSARAMISSGNKQQRAAGALFLDQEGKLGHDEYGAAEASLRALNKDKDINSHITKRIGLPANAPATEAGIEGLSLVIREMNKMMAKKDFTKASKEDYQNKFFVMSGGQQGFIKVMNGSNAEAKEAIAETGRKLKDLTESDIKALAKAQGTTEADVKNLAAKLKLRADNMLSHSDNRPFGGGFQGPSPKNSEE